MYQLAFNHNANLVSSLKIFFYKSKAVRSYCLQILINAISAITATLDPGCNLAGWDCFCFNKTRRVWPVDEFIALCDSNTEYWCYTVLVYTTDNGYMYHWTPCVNKACTRHNKTGLTTSTIGSQFYLLQTLVLTLRITPTS